MIVDHIILVPGLADRVTWMKRLTASWTKYGVTIHVHAAPWSDKKNFHEKFISLLALIDDLSKKKNSRVSLIGISAGGSMVINAFYERRTEIHKVINICGRLRILQHLIRPFSLASKNSPAFRESVLLAEGRIQKLRAKEKKKIMTIRGLYDETVPISTTPIEGATNIQIPFFFHIPIIGSALTLYKKIIINFIVT